MRKDPAGACPLIQIKEPGAKISKCWRASSVFHVRAVLFDFFDLTHTSICDDEDGRGYDEL
jgi:hypothetical protein